MTHRIKIPLPSLFCVFWHVSFHKRSSNHFKFGTSLLWGRENKSWIRGWIVDVCAKHSFQPLVFFFQNLAGIQVSLLEFTQTSRFQSAHQLQISQIRVPRMNCVGGISVHRGGSNDGAMTIHKRDVHPVQILVNMNFLNFIRLQRCTSRILPAQVSFFPLGNSQRQKEISAFVGHKQEHTQHTSAQSLCTRTPPTRTHTRTHIHTHAKQTCAHIRTFANENVAENLDSVPHTYTDIHTSTHKYTHCYIYLP